MLSLRLRPYRSQCKLEDGVVITGHQAVILRGDKSGHYTIIIHTRYSSIGTVNISPGLRGQVRISELQAGSRTVNVLQLSIGIQNICEQSYEIQSFFVIL